MESARAAQQHCIRSLFNVNPNDPLPFPPPPTFKVPKLPKHRGANKSVETLKMTLQAFAQAQLAEIQTALMLTAMQAQQAVETGNFVPVSTPLAANYPRVSPVSTSFASIPASMETPAFDQAQFAQLLAAMNSQQQFLPFLNPIHIPPSPMVIDTLPPPPVPVATQQPLVTQQVVPVISQDAQDPVEGTAIDLSSTFSSNPPRVDSVEPSLAPLDISSLDPNLIAKMILEMHTNGQKSSLSPILDSVLASTPSPPGASPPSSVSPPDLAQISPLLPNSLLEIPAVVPPQTRKDERKAFPPSLTRPPSRRATHADLLAAVRTRQRGPIMLAKPTEEETKIFIQMQKMAHAIARGADLETIRRSFPPVFFANLTPEPAENIAWHLPVQLDAFGAMIIEGLTGPIVAATRASLGETSYSTGDSDKFFARLKEAVEAVPNFDAANDPTTVPGFGGVSEKQYDRQYITYAVEGSLNVARLVKGGFGEVHAPLRAGLTAPQLNTAEKHFNTLRKIVLWQSIFLHRRGIEVDISLLNETPVRGHLRKTMQNRILDLKKFYIYFGSTLSIMLQRDKRLKLFTETGFIPKNIIDMEQLE